MKPVNTFKVSSDNYFFIYRFLDLSCITFSLVFVINSNSLEMTQDYIIVALTALVVFLYIAEALNLYQCWRVGRFITVLMTVIAVFISSFIILWGIGVWLENSFHFPSYVLSTWFFVSFLSCFTWRILKHQWTVVRSKLGINLRKMAILGATSTGANLYHEISHCDELGFDFVGFFDEDLWPSFWELLHNELALGSTKVKLADEREVFWRLWWSFDVRSQKTCKHTHNLVL